MTNTFTNEHMDCQNIAVWYIIQVHGQVKWYWCWYSSQHGHAVSLVAQCWMIACICSLTLWLVVELLPWRSWW